MVADGRGIAQSAGAEAELAFAPASYGEERRLVPGRTRHRHEHRVHATTRDGLDGRRALALAQTGHHRSEHAATATRRSLDVGRGARMEAELALMGAAPPTCPQVARHGNSVVETAADEQRAAVLAQRAHEVWRELVPKSTVAQRALTAEAPCVHVVGLTRRGRLWQFSLLRLGSRALALASGAARIRRLFGAPRVRHEPAGACGGHPVLGVKSSQVQVKSSQVHKISPTDRTHARTGS